MKPKKKKSGKPTCSGSGVVVANWGSEGGRSTILLLYVIPFSYVPSSSLILLLFLTMFFPLTMVVLSLAVLLVAEWRWFQGAVLLLLSSTSLCFSFFLFLYFFCFFVLSPSISLFVPSVSNRYLNPLSKSFSAISAPVFFSSLCFSTLVSLLSILSPLKFSLKSPPPVRLCFQLSPLSVFFIPVFFLPFCYFHSSSPGSQTYVPLCFQSFSVFPPPFSICLSPTIYKGEKGERGLLPLSSHDTGVEWSGGHWAADRRTCLLCNFILAIQEVWVLSIFQVLGESESEKIQGTNLFFPYLYASRGKSSTVLFKTTSCRVPFFFFRLEKK